MPSILTPPEIERRKRREEIREHDNGNGRRPPTDKRTGGNGEGDNWNDRPHGRRGPRDRLSQVRMGIFFGLFGVTMFFIAIVSAFFVTKANGHFDAYSRYINDWLPTAIPSILWLNTAVLILSSASAELARRSMFQEQDVMDEWLGIGRPTSRRATFWLSITLALGIVFLSGQWIAWKQLAAQHAHAANPSSHFFYLITYAHAAHLLLGVTALIAALIGLHRSRRMLSRQVLVDATVWYWHAMGLLWLCLFALLEYGQ
jgi:cytochrome c oxidase subunit 3